MQYTYITTVETYNEKLPPHIKQMVQTIDIQHNTPLSSRIHRTISHLIATDLEDKRLLKFTTTLDSLEPQHIHAMCAMTNFTVHYIKSVQRTVFCHTYDVISHEHFWNILLELGYHFAKETHCNLHQILYESFLFDDKPMTIISFILAVAVLQDNHNTVLFMDHIINTVSINNIADALNANNSREVIEPYMITELPCKEIDEIYVSLLLFTV